ncbi:MAG: hypothetical protein K2O32_04715 [Acetatifactor sp.]|nr:hypothetical protein [Acetatifactor sp.]
MKKGVLSGFLIFLAFMAVCTVIAKGIYKAGLARVSICHPEKMSISHRIHGVGSIVPGQEYGIYTAAGLRVQAVFVQAGEKVEAGAPLFAVDMQDLQEQIQEAQAQADYLQAQIKDLEGTGKEQGQAKEIQAARLQADYDLLVHEQDLLIEACELAEDSARLRMKDAQKQVKEGTVESDLEAKLLKVEYERAQNATEQARFHKEEVLREWNRSLEDAQRKAYEEAAQTVRLRGELASEKLKLEQLNTLEEAQGIVSTAEDSLILGSLLEIGQRTPDGACIFYTALDDAGEIEVPLGEEDAAMLSMGESVNLQFKTAIGETKKETGIISYIGQENGRKLLRIETEATGMLPGQTVSMDTVYKSETYRMVLPLGALTEDNTGVSVVYVVEQCEGILGTEERVRKIPVTVLERNESYAAVESVGLDENSEVVRSSSKVLQEDDVVRVQ